MAGRAAPSHILPPPILLSAQQDAVRRLTWDTSYKIPGPRGDTTYQDTSRFRWGRPPRRRKLLRVCRSLLPMVSCMGNVLRLTLPYSDDLLGRVSGKGNPALHGLFVCSPWCRAQGTKSMRWEGNHLQANPVPLTMRDRNFVLPALPYVPPHSYSLHPDKAQALLANAPNIWRTLYTLTPAENTGHALPSIKLRNGIVGNGLLVKNPIHQLVCFCPSLCMVLCLYVPLIIIGI